VAVTRVFEVTGLNEVDQALRRATIEVIPVVRATTAKALLNIKKDAQQRVTGHKHLPRLAQSFSYETWIRGTQVGGEVGAEVGRGQGSLDAIIELGSPTSPPKPHWAPAGDKEVPVWTRFVEQALLGDFDK
jgi:hypothetical protein